MTKQQEWAKHALGRVLAQKGRGNEAREKYATLCMKAPALLRQAGLVQALAFLQTRKGPDEKKLDEGRQLLTDLAEGLGYKDVRALQEAALEAPLPAYMMLTQRAVSLAIWFRRFAQAELHEDPEMSRRSMAKAFGAAEPRSLRTHVGLWIDKMLVAEEPSSKVSGPHLQKIAEPPIPDGYELAYRKRRALFEAAADRGDSLLFEAKTTSRLVVGLGAKGVLEMGLTLDHTWGTPFIPGSALKGLCAAAAHKLAEGSGWRKPKGWPQAAPAGPVNLASLTDYEMLFGTTANAGLVTFHDAWWVPTGSSLPVHMDVMTVHHPKYYQGETKGLGAKPSDFDEPVPVPFLSTSGTFLIALEGPRPWCEAAGKLLGGGLSDSGVGAKTSSGYGRMALVPIVTEGERARKQRLDDLNNQLRAYKPGTKEVGIRALVRAIQAGVGAGDILAALRQVDKGHRPGLTDGARAQLDEQGRAVLDDILAGLTEVVAAPPAQAAKPSGTEEARRCRARFVVDPKSAKRFFIHIEGEKKAIKSGAVDISAELLEKMRITGEWVDVLVSSGPGKVKVEPG